MEIDNQQYYIESEVPIGLLQKLMDSLEIKLELSGYEGYFQQLKTRSDGIFVQILVPCLFEEFVKGLIAGIVSVYDSPFMAAECLKNHIEEKINERS